LKKEQTLLNHYLNNLQVQIYFSNYRTVPDIWKYLNFIPEFNRMYFICSGEGWIKIRDNEYFPQPGQMIIMPAGTPQSFSQINSNVFVKYYVHFTAKVGDLDLFQLLDMPYCIQMNDRPLIEQKMISLIEHYKSKDTLAPLHMQVLLLELILLYLEQIPPERLRLNASPFINKLETVLTYIDSHLHSQITVEKLAELVHLHPNYFIQRFKASMGLSPIHYVNKARIDRAKQLLSTTEQNISEIAEELGLELFYLSRLFKKYTGLSPSEYRETLTK
jgi:AraC-like DNA-binding protein